MAYSPRFSYAHILVKGLMAIEGARRVVDLLPLPPDADLRLRHRALRRSSHHSTRIEGNTLPETEAPLVLVHPERQTPPDQEVRQYWRAMEWMESRMDESAPVTEAFIRELHGLIMPPGRGRPRKMSEYRHREIGVIDGRRGDYEYMAPKPRDVPGLMGELIEWLDSPEAADLPGPVRAAILAYQFVTIHPFDDGNGRAARTLATYELWRSGYWMRGFLSMEEYYSANLEVYYRSLQMGLPANYYEGRNDPDLSPWLEYFVETMARAADETRESAERLHSIQAPRAPLWDDLTRLQQQALSRCLALASEGRAPLEFTPLEVAAWFGVSDRTAREWLKQWAGAGFVTASSGEQRIRRWRLGLKYEALVHRAMQGLWEK